MKKLKYVGSNTFTGRNSQNFIVYYYIHINQASQTYGVRLEQKYTSRPEEFEYAEEPGITKSPVVAEELANYLIDYEVTPVSLAETLDAFFDEKE